MLTNSLLKLPLVFALLFACRAFHSEELDDVPLRTRYTRHPGLIADKIKYEEPSEATKWSGLVTGYDCAIRSTKEVDSLGFNFYRKNLTEVGRCDVMHPFEEGIVTDILVNGTEDCAFYEKGKKTAENFYKDVADLGAVNIITNPDSFNSIPVLNSK